MDKIEPYDWQWEKARKLAEILKDGPAAFDLSCTGTGKTITSLAMLKILNREALVVAPKKVHSSWVRTAEAMGVGHLLKDVVNAERLQYKNSWFTSGKWVKDKRTKDWTVEDAMWHVPPDVMIIIDEVHRGASGKDSKTTRIMALTKAQRIPVLAMSATLADSPLKMRFAGFLAGLHKFNFGSFYAWCRQNGCFFMENTPGLHFPKGPSGIKHMNNIHEAMSAITVRTSVDEIDGFPEQVLQANLYDLKQAERKTINEVYDELTNIKQGSNALTELLEARQRVELVKIPLLAELALEAIEEGKAPVIFVSFRETLFKLQELLNSMSIRTGRVVGQEDTDDDVLAFEEDKLDAMVCTSASGFGINLHGREGRRPRTSFLCPSYNAVDMVQSLGRIRRLGGSKVIQTFVLIANTIEEKVHQNIQRKLSNIKTLNDGDVDSI
jgi:hypothetical protein